MPNQKPLPIEEKLEALRQVDRGHAWRSLDERVTCILCERTFSGRQIEVTIGATGRVRAKCPTEGCNGTPNVWVSPGNPLVSKKAWRDWERVLEGRKPHRKAGGRKRASTTTENTTPRLATA